MATSAIPVPHFGGKNELSLQDLDALAGAVRAQAAVTEYVPAGDHRGRRQYTGANYNLRLFSDECSGEASVPDKMGLISSVQYRTTDEPYVDSGNMVLPLAHDHDPLDDSSLPTEYATGGVSCIGVFEGLRRPELRRGEICLPLAQTAWPQTAEGAMFTPGLVYGVQYDDECSGGVLPRIEQGVIHLPAPAAGGGGDDTDPSGCTCVPAQYNGSTSLLGLVRSVDFEEDLSSCLISNGRIRLPYAEECTGTVGGVYDACYDHGVSEPVIHAGIIKIPKPAEPAYFPAGVYDAVNARHLTWEELKSAGVVTLSYSSKYGYGIKAFMMGDSLSLFIEE